MELVGQLAALGLVFMLLAAALWWLRRIGAARFTAAAGGRKTPRRLENVERLPLSAQHALHLVRVADQVFLVATHAGGCTLLERLPSQEAETR